ncbi:uncharacterized protein LOC123566642 [Mercenaria mercenaria]|uniref:uncharacterized protein LOC123566642 n=1 Tax=Mercenaria mercenaria TaxID=6596 RepID=UPI00234E6B22|nr:uncharacterized protein LOC123566642 [Mercenaria mercenaria]
MESANLLESSLYCCYKCKGLFGTPDDKLKHQINCMGNPLESACAYFACERKVFLQIFQPEDFLLDGFDPPFLFSKDDSFINHFVKIRVPDIFDPSIFLKTTPQTNQVDVEDPNFLIESNINTLEEETEKSTGNTFLDSSKQVDPIDQDQIQSIINKNIEYLKNDDIPSLSTGRNKGEPSFSRSPSLPRLLSPIDKHLQLFSDKHLHLFGDGFKSRVPSPFERSTGFSHDGQLGYSSGSFMYSSNPSIPFSCGLSTDLFSSIPPSQEENQQAFPTNIEECPTLQYLDLAKKDPFFGQNPGLAQINSKDPFLINASFNKAGDRPSFSLQKSQITRSCEDLQSSPTMQLQDGNYFNFPSTLDEPTQLDYLDLATLDFITNPNLFSYNTAAVKEKAHEKDEDIYSEDNITCHEPGSIRSEAAIRQSTISVSDSGDTDSLSAFSRVKKKKTLRLKKSKSDIERRCENISSHNMNTLTFYPEVREVLVKHPNIRAPEPLYNFQPKISRSLLENRDFRICRKRKLDTQKDKNNDSKLMKVNRKSHASCRISKSDKDFNVREKLTHLSEEQKDKMKAVLGQTGCIFVKKKRSLSCDEPVVYVNDSQVFGNAGIFSEQSIDRDNKFHPVLSNSKALFDQQFKFRKLTSVLQLKCQECSFRCRSVVELKTHRAKHAKKSEPKPLETETTQQVQVSLIPDSFKCQNGTEMTQVEVNDQGLKVQGTRCNVTNLSCLEKIPEASGLDEQPATNYFEVDSAGSFSTSVSVPHIVENSRAGFGTSVVISEVTKELVASPEKAVSILPRNITDISILPPKPAGITCEQYFDHSKSAVCSTPDLNKETARAVEAIESISSEFDNKHVSNEPIFHKETCLRYANENKILDNEIQVETNDEGKQEMDHIDNEAGLDVSNLKPEENDIIAPNQNLGRENETFIAELLHQHSKDINCLSGENTSDKAEVGSEVLGERNQVAEVTYKLFSQYKPDSRNIKQDQQHCENSEIEEYINMETEREAAQIGKTEPIENNCEQDLCPENQTKNSNLTVLLSQDEASVDITEEMEDIGLGIEPDKGEDTRTNSENICFSNESDVLKTLEHVQNSVKENEEGIVHPVSFESVIEVHSENIDFAEQIDISDKCGTEIAEKHSSKCEQSLRNHWNKYAESSVSDGNIQTQDIEQFLPASDNGSEQTFSHLSENLRHSSLGADTELTSDFDQNNKDSVKCSFTCYIYSDGNTEGKTLPENSSELEKETSCARSGNKSDQYCESKPELHACSSQLNEHTENVIAREAPKGVEINVKEDSTLLITKDVNVLDCDKVKDSETASSVTACSDENKYVKTENVLHNQSVSVPDVDGFAVMALMEPIEKVSVPDIGNTIVNLADDLIDKEATNAGHTEMECVAVGESVQAFGSDSFVLTETCHQVADHSRKHTDLDGNDAAVHVSQSASIEDHSPFSKQNVQTPKDRIDKIVSEKNYETIKTSQLVRSGMSSKADSVQDMKIETQNKKDDVNTEHLSSYFLNKALQGPGTKKQIKESDGFFHCDVKGCRFKTLYKSNVSPHYQQVHLALKRFICDQCGYSTPNMTCLKHHMQLNHYKQKRFKCPDCDYLALLHSDIVKHVRHTHMKQKQYACNQCEYRTGHSHSLKLHIMSHSGIRPYKCNSCEYRANNTNKVTRHIKLRHANKVGVACEKQDLTFEIDAKQFQCEEIISYRDIKVIELTTEEVNALMKQKDEKKELEKKAKAAEKEAKEAEKKAKKEMKKAAEVDDISTLNINNKVPYATHLSNKDVKVIKLTPEAAKAFMEAKVSKKLTSGKLEETKYTKMLQKPKNLPEQDTKVTELTSHEVSEFRKVTGQNEINNAEVNIVSSVRKTSEKEI